MTVSIRSLDEGTGVVVDDRIEQRQCRLYTAGPVDPEAADSAPFVYPVDTAATVCTSEVTLPQVPATHVRDREGTIVAEVEHATSHEFGPGEFAVEVSGPIKLYLLVEGPVTVENDTVRTTVTLPAEREVTVGARSYHEHPAATITTTGDPRDLMTAVSYLGSALKTTTCERSYPTLRGHPPAIELGESLDVPGLLDRPETGIRIEVPAELGPAFVVAPLAYYLGARVEPGDRPRIVTDAGFEHRLDGVRGFEREVERVLKQTFLLDCLTRMEDIGSVTLHERESVEAAVDLDFAALYGMDPAEQLAAYLDVPFEPIEEHVPGWKLTAHVAPTPDSAEVVPFLVDDLAVVRTPAEGAVSRPGAATAAIESFLRGSDRPRSAAGGELTRSTSTAPALPSLIEPEPAGSLEQAWVGEGAPVGASKALVEAYRNRLDREPADGDIDIVVVCNDDEMLAEHDAASAVYGSRDRLPLDVTLFDGLTTDRLRLVLESEADFLHYIGHIDDGGFQCTDGVLDAADLETVGVDAFFLNACRSYRQGVELIRGGAAGGVVTLDDVINSGALRVGEAMARLLNRGFPLRAALTIAGDRSIVGGQYTVVGDGNLDIAHAESLTPHLAVVESVEDRYRVAVHTYATNHANMGSMFFPEIAGNDRYYLLAGVLDEFVVGEKELLSFLSLEDVPLVLDGTFTWSDRVDAGDL